MDKLSTAADHKLASFFTHLKLLFVENQISLLLNTAIGIQLWTWNIRYTYGMFTHGMLHTRYFGTASFMSLLTAAIGSVSSSSSNARLPVPSILKVEHENDNLRKYLSLFVVLK